MLTRKALRSNWMQMAVFAQGRHERRHVSVARLRIVRDREAAPRSEVTTSRPAVSRLCGPGSPWYTCVPLDAENRRHPGRRAGFDYTPKWALCPAFVS